MITTRHISLDDECVEKIKPYVEKNKGNFSAAIRDIIDQAGKSGTHENVSVIEISLFKWMLEEIDGILIPDAILDIMIDPLLISSMDKLKKNLVDKFNELEWEIDLSLTCDIDINPTNVLIEIKGSHEKRKLVASIVSQYLVKNSINNTPLEIKSIFDHNDCINVELKKSNKEDSMRSLMTFFGARDEMMKTIKGRPVFWKAIINRHLLSNYNMVTVHRNYFEDILAGDVPKGEIVIETLAKKPVQEIPLGTMLYLIKEVYETSRVVDRVEIDRETLILFHNYRNAEVIEKLRKSLVSLLESNGHLYDAKETANMIVLTHRPDIDTKVNEIVSNLKISNSRVDQEIIMFMAFLKGLKDIPDIHLSLKALGERLGKSLMQEYEEENGVKNWNMEKFQNAFETIHSKLRIESDWKVEGKNLFYKVNKCSMVEDGNLFETDVCHLIQELFRGALNHAFGNKAGLYIKKSFIDGDKSCEVELQIP
jgi:predicted hydrocarbon binding protein